MKDSMHRSKRGQAVVMVGVSLIALSGLMGLAVDLGWSYFVQRMEQAAADGAATAAVNRAMDMMAAGTQFTCAGLGCASPSGCAANMPSGSACTYATSNGFTEGGDGGRQHVMIDTGCPACPPGGSATPPWPVPNNWAPGANVRYWVAVRLTNTVPQLFSAVLGNTTGTVAARAVAGITDGILNGSVVLTGRENDSAPAQGKNINIVGGGQGLGQGVNGQNLTAPDGIFLASLTTPDLGGSGFVSGDAIVRGTYSEPGGWNGSFQHQTDGPQFLDPMRGKGQPPMPNAAPPARPVPGGTINCSSTGNVCPSGVYFATSNTGCATPPCATGAPLTLAPNTTFANSAWGDFIFYGGLDVTRDVQFGPGRYVMAGTSVAEVFKIDDAAVTPTSTSDAGRMVILTDDSYPGLAPILTQAMTNYTRSQPSLGFGELSVSGQHSNLVLNGLDRNQSLPTDANAQGLNLNDFAPAVIWQDQRSSRIKYTADGNVDTSCGSINTPCSNGDPLAGKPGIDMKNGNMTLNGLLYQPRGTFMDLEPGNASIISGNLQIISGGIRMGGTSGINLGPPVTTSPTLVRIATLIN